jgi:hypothetical protein
VSHNAAPPRPSPSADRRPYSVLSPCAGLPTSSQVAVFTASPPPSTSDSSAGESPSAPPRTPVVSRLTPLRSPRRSTSSATTRSSPAAALPVAYLTRAPLEARRSAAPRLPRSTTSAVYTSPVRTSPCATSSPCHPRAGVTAARSRAAIAKAVVERERAQRAGRGLPCPLGWRGDGPPALHCASGPRALCATGLPGIGPVAIPIF